ELILAKLGAVRTAKGGVFQCIETPAGALGARTGGKIRVFGLLVGFHNAFSSGKPASLARLQGNATKFAIYSSRCKCGRVIQYPHPRASRRLDPGIQLTFVEWRYGSPDGSSGRRG